MKVHYDSSFKINKQSGDGSDRMVSALQGYVNSFLTHYHLSDFQTHMRLETSHTKQSDIAHWWEQQKHAPNDPRLQKTYDALKEETLNIALYLRDVHHVRLVQSDFMHQPYAELRVLTRDIEWYSRCIVWAYGEPLPRDHCLAGEVPEYSQGMTWQMLFRGVHECIHAVGWDFNYWRSEVGVFLTSASVYSEDCWPALSNELWCPLASLMAGKPNRRGDGSVIHPGDDDYLPWEERIYPKQKVVYVENEAYYHPLKFNQSGE